MGRSPENQSAETAMSPEQMREAGERLYGKWGWQTQLARELKVDGSTVRRWLSGRVPIPGLASVAINLLVRVYELEKLTGLHRDTQD